VVLTQRVTATQLWFLSILGSEFVSDAVKQLNITLLGVLLHSCDEGPGHGACSLGCDVRIGSIIYWSVKARQNVSGRGRYQSSQLNDLT